MKSRNSHAADLCCIFVHAGAGYHSFQNERLHLQACSDAAKAAMAVLRNLGSAADAVEMAVRVLEDREITNSGYGSNLALDGVVECDALVVDHFGRSGAVGAVSQIKNPVSLARVVLDHSLTKMTLRRVPPNLLVGQGAVEFAIQQGVTISSLDDLISPGARERWTKWKAELDAAEERVRERTRVSGKGSTSQDAGAKTQAIVPLKQIQSDKVLAAVWNEGQPGTPRPTNLATAEQAHVPSSGLPKPSQFSAHAVPSTGSVSTKSTMKEVAGPSALGAGKDESGKAKSIPVTSSQDGDDSGSSSEMELPSLTPTASPPGFTAFNAAPNLGAQDPIESATDDTNTVETPSHSELTDFITDTVGAIAIDSCGRIACAASSGGIGLKHRGRLGPAALVGAGAAVIPLNEDDGSERTVGVVTSGTGEHLAATQAAGVAASRMYDNVCKTPTGRLERCVEEEAITDFVNYDFMGHPSVRHSNAAGAIGLLCLKKDRHGISLYFAHNTESFAMASMSSDEAKPSCTMSRKNQSGSGTALGGKVFKFKTQRRSARN